jgi:hypothetical protein
MGFWTGLPMHYSASRGVTLRANALCILFKIPWNTSLPIPKGDPVVRPGHQKGILIVENRIHHICFASSLNIESELK